jgi:hypothetical protein
MTRLLLVLVLYFQATSPGSQIEVPLVVGEGQTGRAHEVISTSVIAVPFEGTPLQRKDPRAAAYSPADRAV